MLKIGIINNMAPSAIQSTERQFEDILANAAGSDVVYQLRWYRLSGIRPTHYGRMEDLWAENLDGLVVTGAEPKASSLPDEPLWPNLIKTIDWAAQSTSSVIWSCLAAHAAVLHLSGIERCPSDEKIFGIFDVVRTSDHEIVAGTDAIWRVPHSRWNDLPEDDLIAHGYSILARSPGAGVDTFIKNVGRSLFVFLQSHPEYKSSSLMREYHRDVARFYDGKQQHYPNVPRNYFDKETSSELEAARNDRAGQDRVIDVLDRVRLESSWTPLAVKLYRNWLSYLKLRSCVIA